MRHTILIMALTAVAACAPVSPAEQAPAASAGTSIPTDAASCKHAGGTFTAVGRRQTLQCVIAFADAGKSCSSGSQCAGDCQAKAGVDAAAGEKVAGFCQATSNRFGCSTQVENGRAQSTICID